MKNKKSYSVLIVIILALWIVSSCKSRTENSNSNGDDNDTSYIVKDTNDVVDGTTSIVLAGNMGNSAEWKSGWMDLDPPLNFNKGDSLKLNIGGTAHTILVRLLSIDEDPNSPVGIVGGKHTVDKNGDVCIMINRDYTAIIQISVHGGDNPWGVYPLGANNGAATIISIELIR